MISIFAALNGSILTGSRVPYAAARDGYFFHAVAYIIPVSARRASHSCADALGLRTHRAIGWVQRTLHVRDLRELDSLWDGTAAVIVLRKKRPDLARPIPDPGVSICAGAICFGGDVVGGFDAEGLPMGIDEGHCNYP